MPGVSSLGMDHRDSPGSPAPRIIGGVLSVLVGLVFLWMLVAALVGRFGSGDPHGYGLIFGTFLALVTGLILSVTLPLVFPRAKRSRAFVWTLGGYVVVTVILIILLTTA